MDRQRENQGRAQAGYGPFGNYDERLWRYGDPDWWQREFCPEQTMQSERYRGFGCPGYGDPCVEGDCIEPAEREYLYGGCDKDGPQPDQDLSGPGPAEYGEPPDSAYRYGRYDYYGQPEWRFSSYGRADEYREPSELGYRYGRYEDYGQGAERFGAAGEGPGPFAGIGPRNYRRFGDLDP